MTIGLIFPGQGAQYSGMGKDLYNKNQDSKKLYKKADKISQELGLGNISDLCFNGSAEDLKKTKNTQPAIYVTSMAAFKAIEPYITSRIKNKQVFAGGHSVGEYAALAASGIITFEQGLRLVARRGELMQKSSGTLAAIIGINRETINKVLDDNTHLALVNCPGQYVIGGKQEYIQKAVSSAIELGANRRLTRELKVSGAFHTPLYNDISEEFRKDNVFQFVLGDSNFPVISNFSSEWYNHSNLKNNLVSQINNPVEWELCTNKLLDKTTTFIELGPKTTVSGMIKKTASNMDNVNLNLMNVEDTKSLLETIHTIHFPKI